VSTCWRAALMGRGVLCSTQGAVEFPDFVEVWEALTGESVDKVVATCAAEDLRQQGLRPKNDPLR
jgi:hypothetical protein